MTSSLIKGHATPEGTAAYKARFEGRFAEGHFREKDGLWFSSIGIGSYLGESDEATDKLYEESLEEAVTSGINVIDSAINYRSQRSERNFGRALRRLIESGRVKREEVIVCTKGGFLPFDGGYPADPAGYFKRNYFETGIVKPEDVAQGCHAMTPAYLEDQLEKSLANLGLETIDIYYIHNPETQLADVDRRVFLNRMREAFAWMEKKAGGGKIGVYGTATWNGYRLGPEAADYLSLQELAVLGREAGGAGHHFKAVQLPFNLAMTEAWVLANQSFGAHAIPLLAAAEKLGMIVIGSAALLQGRLTGPFPDFLDPHFKSLKKSSQRAIQFARSVHGITTSLVGMKTKAHARENLVTAKVPPLGQEELFLMFQQAG